jgi:putative acetyltransferase
MLNPYFRAMTVRDIRPSDNPYLARIVKDTLTEFHAAYPGTVFDDPTTDTLFELFAQPRACYFVLDDDGTIAGGAGIHPTEGLPPDTCELVKMYLVPRARGLGHGKALIQKCFDAARELKFRKMYLESLPELKGAVRFYEAMGFKFLPQRMGNSGHFASKIFMLRDL